MKQEKWAEVPGYEGVYIVSPDGRVARILKPRFTQGYMTVKLYGVGTPRYLAMTTILRAAFNGGAIKPRKARESKKEPASQRA